MLLHEYQSKAAGAFYGFCIGDAMGATTEFMDAQDIKAEYGEVNQIIGGGWLKLEPGQVTDDSQMMFCIIDALKEVGVDCNVQRFKHAVARHFEAWLATDPADVGNTCRAGINAYTMAHHQYFIKHNDDLLGNGGLMRFLPLALLQMESWNIAQNDITHPSEVSARAIQTTHKVIRDYLMGNNPSELPKRHQRPQGTCDNTLNNALLYQNEPSFRSAIIKAVNDGGDADTIAAITGGLYGCKCGLSNIDTHWIAQLSLDVKKRIGDAVNTICKLAEKVHPEWFTDN